jgi:hypothetical protein
LYTDVAKVRLDLRAPRVGGAVDERVCADAAQQMDIGVALGGHGVDGAVPGLSADAPQTGADLLWWRALYHGAAIRTVPAGTPDWWPS